MSQFFSRFGVPGELHSDQGRNFESSVFQEVCTLLGIHKTRTTALHPQSDGMVERYNRIIEAQLATFVQDHQKDWDRHLPLLLMSYRSAVHETTKFTPAMLMFGRELRVPLDLLIGRPQEELADRGYPEYVEKLRESVETVHNFARVHQQEGSLRMKRRYDMRIVASTFGSGDLVWLHNPQRKKGISPKLRRIWEGPYVVVERLNDVVYRIQRGPRAKPKVVHRDRLWKYSGVERADWFKVPVQDKSEDVSTQTTTQQENQEDNTKGRASVRHPRRRQTLSPRFRKKNYQDKEAYDGASGQQEGLRRSSRERRTPPRYRDYEMT